MLLVCVCLCDVIDGCFCGVFMKFGILCVCFCDMVYCGELFGVIKLSW